MSNLVKAYCRYCEGVQGMAFCPKQETKTGEPYYDIMCTQCASIALCVHEALAAAPAQPAAQALDAARVFWQQHTGSDALSMTMAELHADAERAIRTALATPAQPDAHMRELAAYRLKAENLERENATLQHEFAKLKSPEGVRLAMLRGAIAKPSLRECAHAHGADALQALDKALAGTAPAFSKEYVGWVSVADHLPEPGLPVLLDVGGKFPIRAMWAAKHTVPAGEDDTDWAEYVEADDAYYSPEGWYEWNQHEETHWKVSATPLAWAALPATHALRTGGKP